MSGYGSGNSPAKHRRITWKPHLLFSSGADNCTYLFGRTNHASFKRDTPLLPSVRQLPDPDLTLRDACDFIFDSALARKALSYPTPPDLANFLRELISTIYKLAQSCHLPEFTDHGLSHLCSLVDRLSQWSVASESSRELKVVEQAALNSEDATILLLATLIHDIGMLSQRPEDMPVTAGGVSSRSIQDIPTWVRATHISRIPKLVERLFQDTEYDHYFGSSVVQRAIHVAEAHGFWPWEWDRFEFAQKDAGLAAMLAVADLLDEDSLRCDSATLLKHRFGNPLNCAHWVRHGLTAGRVLVKAGSVKVSLARPPTTDSQLGPVFDALRNHYKLVLLYTPSLGLVNAGLLSVEFNCAENVPTEISGELRGWHLLPDFGTQAALVYHLLDSFMAEALLDAQRLSSYKLEKLARINLRKVSLQEYYSIKGTVPPRTPIERSFHALLAHS